MALIQKILNFLKRKNISFTIIDKKNLRIQKLNPLILVAFLVLFSGLFFLTTNKIIKKNSEYSNNLKEISKNNEFSNFTNFLLSKINSPYEEINYLIENNDTVEKILKKFNIRNQDIKIISSKDISVFSNKNLWSDSNFRNQGFLIPRSR